MEQKITLTVTMSMEMALSRDEIQNLLDNPSKESLRSLLDRSKTDIGWAYLSQWVTDSLRMDYGFDVAGDFDICD